MRLPGEVLRPSLNQVTCGWGKLRMRGAGITAPSPWETDWVRSPSSKLPITTGRNKQTNKQTGTHKDRETHERVTRVKVAQSNRHRAPLFLAPRLTLPSAFCCEVAL